MELTTLTVSVHRVKSPAPACGYINTKGWARGRRTIAGTMVMTKLTTDVLFTFLLSSAFTSDLSKDSTYVKVDQLPPFNISMLFADEYGHMSYQRVLGIEFVTSGDVYSIQDMLTEQTRSLRPAAPKTPRAGAQAEHSSHHGTLFCSSVLAECAGKAPRRTNTLPLLLFRLSVFPAGSEVSQCSSLLTHN